MKQFTKITVLGLVFALALGSANCKKDEKDDTGTMLALLLLLNQSSCGKVDYSLGYFLNQVAPPAALTGVGGYPWSYDTCKPLSAVSQFQDSATKSALGTSTSNFVGVTTVFTYDSSTGKLSKRVATSTYYMPASTIGTNGAILHTASSYASCNENSSTTAPRKISAVKTTNYTRDASGNVTKEETTFSCDGNAMKKANAAYARKDMTYNSDNRMLTLKYYINGDLTASAATPANSDYTNSSSTNPIATQDYTYTPTSGIPTSISVVSKTYYVEVDKIGTATRTDKVTTTPVDIITHTVGTTTGKLTSASATVSCQAYTPTSTTAFYVGYIAYQITGNNCVQYAVTATAGTPSSLLYYGSNLSGGPVTSTVAGYLSETKDYTITHDTKKTNLLSTLQEVRKYKDSTGATSTTRTTTWTYYYNSDDKLSRIDSYLSSAATTSGTTVTTITDTPSAGLYGYENGSLRSYATSSSTDLYSTTSTDGSSTYLNFDKK